MAACASGVALRNNWSSNHWLVISMMAKSTYAPCKGRIQARKTPRPFVHIRLAPHGRSMQLGQGTFRHLRMKSTLPRKAAVARVLHDATVFRNGWARHRPLGALSVWRGSFFVVGIASHVSGYTLPPWTRNGMSRLSRELMTCTLPGELFARIAVQPSKKKYFVSRMGRNSNRASLVPYPQEGRFAIVTNVGLRDAVDARCVKTRRVDRARRSRVVLASRRRCQVGDDACASRRRR
jgi:hypothetical protein